jgi:acetyltransferase-like isoleucine patch superfamily enzyme
MQSFKQRLFFLLNQVYRVRMRFWTGCYTPFLGVIGLGSRIEKVSFLRNPHRIFLGRNVFIGHSARIETFTQHGGEVYSPTITIGDGTTIEPYSHIGAAAAVTIGCSVVMASRIYITDHDHTYDDPDRSVGLQPLRIAPVEIGDFVWLGENVMVLKGVTIGHHAIIGAGSVVTRDIPPYAIAAGSPARVIRMRPAAPETL